MSFGLALKRRCVFATAASLNRKNLIECCAGLLVFAFLARHFALRLADPDLWGRLAVGQLVLWQGRMPPRDPFAYTPTLPRWIDHQWLTGVVFYGIDHARGDAGILLFKTLLGLATVGLVWLAARAAGAARLPLLILLALAMPVFGYGIMPWAQLFTYFFFALWLYLLERYRRGGSTWLLTALPLTMLLWANLHGGFLAGLGLLALYALGMIHQPRRCLALAAVGVGCFLATLINPYGWDYWRYLLPAVAMHRPGVAEWAPVPFHWEYAAFWLLAACAIATLWTFRRDPRTSLAVVLTVSVTLLLAARHARHMPLFAIAACGLLPGIVFPDSVRATALRGRLRPADLALAALLLAVALVQVRGLVGDGPARLVVPDVPTGVENMVVYPVGAVRFAVDHQIQGNLAVPFNWGEYVLWRLYPNCRVSLDGRYETVYPDSTVEMVDRFFAASGHWSTLIDAYPTHYVLAPRDAPVNEKLANRGWTLRFSDQAAMLWQRPR